MEFVQTDIELLDRMPYHLQHQVRQMDLEQTVQATSDTVVVQVLQVVFPQSEFLRGESFGPLAQTINGFPRDKHVADHQHQATSDRYGRTLASLRQMLFQNRLELESLKYLVHDRQTADRPRT